MKKINQKSLINFFSGLFLVLLFLSCTKTDLTKENIIPKPNSVVAKGTTYKLTDKTAVVVVNQTDELNFIAVNLAGALKNASGFDVEVKTSETIADDGNIYLKLSRGNEGNGNEAYTLNINKKSIVINAENPAGLFYGVQTLKQLLPLEKNLNEAKQIKIPTGEIIDFPEYNYRGTMLDVARHFFEVEELKTLIDQMALYKLNTLHLHLSDDQGWRIEIKSWPNLTIHGGSTEVGGGSGGFYTQEQYSGIVNYAKERFITIIPEIDMPGHTNAALASYPELNCNGKATELYTGIKVGFSTLCTDKEITYKFIDDVINELVQLTPGEYIHIGGDESHATKIEDYIPFINRVQELVESHGKKVIGWDEIAHASLKSNTIVQYWAKAENAVKGINQGAKVLMSPAKLAYLDMQYDSTSIYGLHWAAYIEIDKAYNWDPANIEPEIKRENIIGIEAPLWSETVSNLEEAEYLIYPRLLGYAEIGWTKPELRNWDEYKNRLVYHGARMKALNINFYESKLLDWNIGSKTVQ